MQNKDLFMNVSVNSSIGGEKPPNNLQKYQKQRAHHLPLGGMMGERAAKFMTLYDGEFDETMGRAGEASTQVGFSNLPSP